MPSHPLPHYLRASRKRLSLSQGDVAFLVGTEGGTKFSRYERFAREPNLQTAIACEIIFDRAISELFGGLYHRVEKDVAERAKILLERTKKLKPDRHVRRRLEALSALIAKYEK